MKNQRARINDLDTLFFPSEEVKKRVMDWLMSKMSLLSQLGIEKKDNLGELSRWAEVEIDGSLCIFIQRKIGMIFHMDKYKISKGNWQLKKEDVK